MSSYKVHLHDERGRSVRYIKIDDSNTLMAEGTAEAYYHPVTGEYLGIKMCSKMPEPQNTSASSSSNCGLTRADIELNAAGTIDTEKRPEIYRLRAKLNLPPETASKAIPAYIRYYGREPGFDKKTGMPVLVQNPNLLGNNVDIAQTRVENWAMASSDNRAVTIIPGGVIGLTVMSREDLAKL